MKAILRFILASCYSFARKWVNPKYGGDVIWTTTYSFLTPLSFIAAGFYAILVYYLNDGSRYQSSYAYVIPIFIIIVAMGYGLQKSTRNALTQWGIIKEFKGLSKRQRRARNTFAFFFFFFGFFLFFYLGVKFIAP